MSLSYSQSISCYAADTAGVCSALFELGGMTIVHDASGCNSTYATHDEPRWYDADSMVYISALTEMDAVCGNDQKLIDDVVRSARELRPRFIALCNSPIPLMIGSDMAAIAREIEQASGIASFAVPTSGMEHYWRGAADAFLQLAKRFLPERDEKTGQGAGVNILGATPLDFSLNGNVESIVEFLQQNNYVVQSCWAMNSSWEDIMSTPQAAVNLVISNSGLPLAHYLRDCYGIPFVCGVPLGAAGSRAVKQALDVACREKRNLYSCKLRHAQAGVTGAVIGESIFSGSLAYALSAELQINCRVIDPLNGDKKLLDMSVDKQITGEDAIAAALEDVQLVVADPMYAPVISAGKKFLRLPHEAFSGRCYHRERLNLINKAMVGLFNIQGSPDVIS